MRNRLINARSRGVRRDCCASDLSIKKNNELLSQRNGSYAGQVWSIALQQLERERSAPSLTAAMSASSWAGAVPIWCARPSCEYLEKGGYPRMCAVEGED